MTLSQLILHCGGGCTCCCRSVDSKIPLVGIDGLDGVKQALSLYTSSPNWMTRVQPLGTPGTSGSWNGKPQWPGLAQISAAMLPHLRAGDSLDYPAMRDWFLQRYEQWKQDNTVAITLQDVVDVLSSDAVWVKPGARGVRRKADIWLDGAEPIGL